MFKFLKILIKNLFKSSSGYKEYKTPLGEKVKLDKGKGIMIVETDRDLSLEELKDYLRHYLEEDD